jgi:hypothetical protein
MSRQSPLHPGLAHLRFIWLAIIRQGCYTSSKSVSSHATAQLHFGDLLLSLRTFPVA